MFASLRLCVLHIQRPNMKRLRRRCTVPLALLFSTGSGNGYTSAFSTSEAMRRAHAPSKSRTTELHYSSYDAATGGPSVAAQSFFSNDKEASLWNDPTLQLIDLEDIFTGRDVYSMEEWCVQNGVERIEGIQLYTEDGADYGLSTQVDLPAGSTIVYVPSSTVISSDQVAEDLGGSLEAAENALIQMETLTARRIPLFRLMVFVLKEYEKGVNSKHYAWLQSLPRQYYNGVSMTEDCFGVLPPYAAKLAKSERENYNNFVAGLREGYVDIADEIVDDDTIVNWAYNVALTRFIEVWQPNRQKKIVPMVDMINHSSEPNVDISFDDDGNCLVTTLYDIPAGSALTISLGDPTNPTPIFAQYGFLPLDCTTIFCKAVHLDKQIKELGYDYRDLLIETQTGEVAPKVWDIFLYELLQYNDEEAAEKFYVACRTNDIETKEQYHSSYFQYTLESLKAHVYSMINSVDQLTISAISFDLGTHPRVPVIVAHNTLVKDTFANTALLLEQMG
mmetsp:Transcript_8903/g.20696  ORF Transcript_8903/g.20696 Transcript_8903/m.20696 type:complete len:505 (-) Transcript_8903:59-1573(-)